MATWPDVHIPRPKGPTAREHLKRISKAAQEAASPNLTDIEKAIEACAKGECLQKGTTLQRGKPPPDPEHGSSVLAARAYATDPPDWDECLKALRHGEPQDQAKKQRA